jgi:argininosuccinate lyase
VGRLVARCQALGIELSEASEEDLQTASPHLTRDVRSVLSVAGALAARDTPGGTAPVRVREQLAALRSTVAEHRAWAER